MVAVLIFAYTQLIVEEEEYDIENAWDSVNKWNEVG